MKILSLFDGISCARVALERAGIPVEAYYASEIDKYAMQVSAKNWPEIVQVGSVVGLDCSQFKDIDLMVGGSPCQDLSIAKAGRKGLDGARSGLFWEYVRILKEVKPKYFILENVASMPKEAKALISETLGVEPIMIDAQLVSAQRRKRLFWTNIPGVALPEDRHIYLKDILQPESEVDEKYYIKDATLQTILEKMRQGKPLAQAFRIHDTEGKRVTLSAMGGGSGAKTGLYYIAALTERRTEEAKKLRSEMMKKIGKDFSPRRAKELVTREDGKANTLTTGITKEHLVVLVGKARGKNEGYESNEKAPTLTGSSWQHNYFLKLYSEGKLRVRKLTPIECERLQSLPDGYTEEVSNTQRYRALGNAFNVEVVAHILRSLPTSK